jgi:superfamily II DNA helicase RecQ
LDDTDQARVIEDFGSGACRVVSATSGFGVGLEFPDVALVVMVVSPYSFLDFIQQTGRAGRDHRPATAILVSMEPDPFNTGFLSHRLPFPLVSRQEFIDIMNKLYTKVITEQDGFRYEDMVYVISLVSIIPIASFHSLAVTFRNVNKLVQMS